MEKDLINNAISILEDLGDQAELKMNQVRDQMEWPKNNECGLTDERIELFNYHRDTLTYSVNLINHLKRYQNGLFTVIIESI